MKKKPVKKTSPASKAKASKYKKQNLKGDIINLISEDHKSLKRLIKVLKNSDKEFDVRMDAFAEFAPLLVNHAKSEEQSLYVEMKKTDELREEAFEGDVEHGLADQLLEEIKRTEDEDHAPH